MKEELVSLLDKYYRGETTVDEDMLLKEKALADEDNFPEKELFSWFQSESEVPEDLNEHIFRKVEDQVKKRKLRYTLYSLTSIAATFTLIITLYAGYRTGQKNARDFRMIEQALYQVSETLQPEQEEPDMFVLWVDNNVEIIVN